MKRMLNWCVALVAMFVLVNCAEKSRFEALEGDWRVVSVGELLVPDSVDAFMGFNVAEQLVYGCTGCNHLTGALPTEANPSSPLFANMGSTRMLCADMAIEDAMLPALAKVVDFKVEGDNLYFLNAEGATVITLAKR